MPYVFNLLSIGRRYTQCIVPAENWDQQRQLVDSRIGGFGCSSFGGLGKSADRNKNQVAPSTKTIWTDFDIYVCYRHTTHYEYLFDFGQYRHVNNGNRVCVRDFPLHSPLPSPSSLTLILRCFDINIHWIVCDEEKNVEKKKCQTKPKQDYMGKWKCKV